MLTFRKPKGKLKGPKKRDLKLSFEDEEEETSRKRISKDPKIDTSFLPDRDREEEERTTREQLRLQWLSEQEKIKDETVEITYSFWDGSGHRKTVQCKKGDTIAAFLAKSKLQIPELRGTSIDNMMYIKVSPVEAIFTYVQEDLIIPHVCELSTPN